MSDQTTIDTSHKEIETGQEEGHTHPHQSGLWLTLLVIWGVLGTLVVIMLVAYSQNIFLAPVDEIAVQNTLSPEPVFSPAPSATPEPTVTPTAVAGGYSLVLTPAARDVGWVVSDDESIVTGNDPQNHFGDSFLYAGVLDGKIFHAAFQFDLDRIPRGTKINSASLHLTGLRRDLLGENAQWQLQLLAPEIDYYWRSHNYQQIHQAVSWATFEQSLSPEDLGEGRVNIFAFSSEQLALLERRLIEGSDQFGKFVSFRLDGSTMGDDSLFAWDSGYGPASNKAGPELFLSLGPPPQETPPPYYVVITSTPTPENIMTAVANSLQITAEAAQFGTATPLPPNWVTPVVVTATPTPGNQATAQVMNQLATAIAMTTGQPPNLQVVTPTATPTYVIITSTPAPENIMTAVANSLQITAEAAQFGTATPLPPNWVTPVVVTATPTPGNQATAQVMNQLATAIAMTTGQPINLATATPTPTYVVITSTPTPEHVITAAAQAMQVTAEAGRKGTATPLPPNWVTPLVVTSTPTPENSATAVYQQAVAMTTGTPTPLPDNVQTATPTPISVRAEPLASPTATATPTATSQPIPAALRGKIIFMSDREGVTEEERLRADKLKVTPQVTPQPYVYDPATGQLDRLTDRWPYDVAAAREGWSADKNFETYTQLLRWTNIVGDNGKIIPTEVFAIHYYDYVYEVEHIVTRMGAGVAYDPVWSPVSNQIAFVSTESRNDEIWVINYDGSNVRQLTRNEWEWDKHPSWSPDGEQIVFYSNRTGNNQIWIMNQDGGEQRLLMDWNPYNDWDPVWVKYLEPAPPSERKLDWRFIKPPAESGQSR